MISEDGRERLFNCFALLVIKQLFNHCLCLRFRDPRLSITAIEPVSVPSKRRPNGHVAPSVFKVMRSERGAEEIRVQETSRPAPPPPLLQDTSQRGEMMEQSPELAAPEYAQRPEIPDNDSPTDTPMPENTPPEPSPSCADKPLSPVPQIPAPEPKVAYILLRPSSRTALRPSRSVRTFEYLVLEKETKQAPASSLSKHAHYFLGSSFR